MNPKRTAVLWFAGGLLALTVVLGLALAGVFASIPAGHVVAVTAVAGAASAFLGERRHLANDVRSP